MLEKYFEYKKHKTDFKTEVIAGTTTFLTMAYIMFLNPFILSGEFAGPEKGFFDFGAVYTATILATALACFIMAFYGKSWPIGLGTLDRGRNLQKPPAHGFAILMHLRRCFV